MFHKQPIQDVKGNLPSNLGIPWTFPSCFLNRSVSL